MQIGPGRIIDDIIDVNKVQYIIPVYQRNYEWSKEQCVKLFEDIVAAYERDMPHFCGTIVYAPINDVSNVNKYMIIDGQQRLTTIYILLKAMLDCAETDKETEVVTETMFNRGKYDDLSVEKASKLKLKPIKSDNNQLNLLMENRTAEIDKNSGIWRNYVLFCELIKEQQSKEITVKSIYKGLERLVCARISLDSYDNAQEIFERINSTGLPLSLEDKIRNFVLMTNRDQERLYEEYWLVAENLVGKDKMTSFFIDYLNFRIDGFVKLDDAYEAFKKYYRDNGYDNKQMLEEIKHYAKFYHVFLYGDKNYSEGINRYLADLRELNQATLYYFLFSLFDDYEKKAVSTEEVEKVLRFLLAYSVRRLICEVGSNSLRGLYKTLYNRVFANPENKNHYYDSVVSFFNQLTTKDAIPDDTSFRMALRYNNLYKKNALCKYLLSEIENQGKTKIVTESLTIEHIMPQNKNLSTVWQNMLGEDWAEVKEKYLNTIGNLTLTSYNSELGDKPFDEKLKLLSDMGEKAVVLYSDVSDKTSWNAETIEARADRLTGIITGMFSIEKPSVEIKFRDEKYREYSCDYPEDATYKTPNYYVLCNDRVAVSTFAEMMRSVIDRLYAKDKTIIEEMAKNNERPVDWSSKVLFSYDGEITGDYYKVGDSDIYVSCGYSASHIMYIISALLEKYGLDHADFSYSARESQTISLPMATAMEWCKSKPDSVRFSKEYSNKAYVRFATPAMSEILPDLDVPSKSWNSPNYYFYEIQYQKDQLYIQMYVYKPGMTDELKQRAQKAFDLLGKSFGSNVYTRMFLSSKLPASENDSAEEISAKLDALFGEVKEFETDLMKKWK